MPDRTHHRNNPAERRVCLGIPIDLFFDRDRNQLSRHEQAIRTDTPAYDMPGGLVLPDDTTPGTGNVVIRGRPGSGKSILAMQVAQKVCEMNGDDFFSWFIALEETPEHVLQKAARFGWRDYYQCIRNLNEFDELTNPEEYGEILRRILSKDVTACPILRATEDWKASKNGAPSLTPEAARHEHRVEGVKPRVCVSRLSPRHLSPTSDREADIFEERLRQIENLLCGAKWLRANCAELPQLAVVCIDSLNVFGDQLLTREQLYRLFDLFKRNGVIGVFVLEEDEGQEVSPDDRMHGNVIEFLADVVVALEYGEDGGYRVRYFEIIKSRHQHQVYGKHPFKLVKYDEKEAGGQGGIGWDNPNMPVRHGVVIFPSLHYIVYGTETIDDAPNQAGREAVSEPFDLGFNNESSILPYDCKQGDIVLLEGPPGTFKRTLGVNFLLKGLIDGENVLLIELADRPSFSPTPNRISEELCTKVRDTLHLNMIGKLMEPQTDLAQATQEAWKKYEDGRKQQLDKRDYIKLVKETRTALGEALKAFPYEDIHNKPELMRIRRECHTNLFYRDKGQLINNTKYTRQVYLYNGVSRFTEIAFKSGYVMPEEFIQTIRDILLLADQQKHPITRIVFSNIGLLGVSYPLLGHSRTAGDLFLTAFVHIVRNYRNISLLMTGATDQYCQADEIISRARALVDVDLKCSFCDVFGNRYVVIEGEGLTTGPASEKGAWPGRRRPKEYGEYTPGVIVPRERKGISTFEVDVKRLEGLVGFKAGHLHRPGIIFYTFEEGRIHARYNDNIRKMLQYTFGVSGPTSNPDGVGSAEAAASRLADVRSGVSAALRDAIVNVESFSSYHSEAMHSSLNQFGGQPLDKTIVNTVDEFYLSEPQSSEKQASKHVRRAQNAFIRLGKYVSSGRLIDAFKHFEDDEGEENYIWPYYGNILLLAYRFVDDDGKLLPAPSMVTRGPKWDEQEVHPWRSWKNVRDYAAQLKSHLEESARKSGRTWQYCDFEYYHCTSETLSCVLLDALISGSRLKPGANQKSLEWRALLNPTEGKLTEEQVMEIRALQDLLAASAMARNACSKPEKSSTDVEPPFSRPKEHQTMPEEHPYISASAAVYLCWYSQLRELLELHPYLTDKIRVVALPGGGFRGDWYVGVSRGSVSNELGKQLIQMLCSEREQYKRFAAGVGLPILQSFANEEKKYFAWPQGEHVKVAQLYRIHGDANTRCEIPDYNNFRSILATICQQLIRTDYEKLKIRPSDLANKVNDNVGRLFTQIAMFTDMYSAH